MNQELRPLSEISEVKQDLFRKYIKFLNPPKSYIKDLRKEFDIIMRYRTSMMPYFLVKELITLGFDVDEESLDDKF
tara:strand:+ start:684 stop:911 length:228 start_codon:yes stop_codon:yes gene_type:complete